MTNQTYSWVLLLKSIQICYIHTLIQETRDNGDHWEMVDTLRSLAVG